jgi:hypothetical protein
MSVEENDSRDVSTRQDTTSELSFDDLARGLGSGALSRRQAMRLLGGSLLGSALALIPGVAGAAPQGPKCKPLHDKCTTNVQCCSNFCDKNGKQCSCPPETEIACNNRCVPTCHDTTDPCKISVCNPTTGNCVVANAMDGTLCEDGNPCTLGDTCNNGTCRPGDVRTCPDTGNPCTVSVCDQQTGICEVRNRADGTDCNADNNACTENDSCQAGACVPGPLKTCPASTDPCKVNVCDPATGNCVPENAEDGTQCEDGDLCTVGDTCQNGTCRPGDVTTCPPTGNPCTVSVCNPNSGICQIQNQTGSCDDGNPCTRDDRCQSGVCVGDPIAGCLRCNSPSDCPTPTQCQTATCTGGVCGVTNRTGSCNDNNPCTTNDQCQNGVCTGTAVTCSPSGGQPQICCATGSNAGSCRRATGTPCSGGGNCCSGTCSGGICA